MRPEMIHKLRAKCYSGKEQNTYLEQSLKKKRLSMITQFEFLLESRLQYSVAWGGFSESRSTSTAVETCELAETLPPILI